MKRNEIIQIGIHLLLLFALQVIILMGIDLSILDRYALRVFIYPLIILMMPVKTPKLALLLLAFVIGLIMDSFYNSPGVHAGALVLAAYIRTIALKIFEPRGGYRGDHLIGMGHFECSFIFKYNASVLLFFLLGLYSLEWFSIVYIDKILINTLMTFVTSYIVIAVYQFLVK